MLQGANSRSGGRELSALGRTALAFAILAPALIVRPGTRTPSLLAPEYAIKSWLAVAGMLGLACAAWSERATEPRLGARGLRIVTAVATLALWYAISGLAAAQRPYFDLTEAIVRVVLPAATAVLIVAGVPIGGHVLKALRWTALALAVLVLLDLGRVCALLLPSQSSPSATLIHRNNVGMALATAMPFFVLRLARARWHRFRQRAFELALLSTALFGCRSRTAWIAAAAGVAIAALMTARSRRSSARAAGWVTIPLLLLVGLAAARSLRSGGSLERLDDRLSHTVSLGDPAMRERYDIYHDALRLVRARPWLGWGAGRFSLLRRANYSIVETVAGDAATIDPEWSSAGRELAFTTDDGASALFVADGDVARPRVVATPGPLPSRPAISADGTRIAVHEIVPSLGLSYEHRLRIFDRASGRTLAVVEAAEGEFVARAVFAHDGRRLAYEHVRREIGGWSDEVRLLALDQPMPHDRSLIYDPPRSARGLTWSRDDATLFYTSERCLGAVDVVTGRRRSLGCGEGDFFPVGAPPPPPVLSPDGRTLAFTFERFGCPRVFTVEVDGSQWRPAAPECASRPAWLADGRLAYVVTREDGAHIAVATVGATAATLWPAPGGVVLQLDGMDGAVRALTQTSAGRRAVVRVDAGGVEPLLSPPAPRPRPICDHPHDDLLGIAVEAGVPAALAFAVLIVGAALSAWRSRSPRTAALAAALSVLIVFGVTNAPLLLAPSAAMFWLTLAGLALERPAA